MIEIIFYITFKPFISAIGHFYKGCVQVRFQQLECEDRKIKPFGGNSVPISSDESGTNKRKHFPQSSPANI